MTLFWNSQFREKKGTYVFDPRRVKFQKVKKSVNEAVESGNSIVLSYEATFDGFSGKDFLLKLYNGRELVKETIGAINSVDPNEEYYRKINEMRKLASDIIKKREEEISKIPMKGTC